MKMMLPLAALFLAAGIFTHAIADNWLTDYDKALEQAKAENKPVLLDFTGSDWCGWCMKMKEEVLDKPEFKQYAKRHLILMEVDFPQGKRQTEKVKEQNNKLAQQFNVRGYPCFVLVNAEGKELGRQGGYLQGGAKAFIDLLNTFYKPAPAEAKPAAGSSGRGDFDNFFKKPAATPAS